MNSFTCGAETSTQCEKTAYSWDDAPAGWEGGVCGPCRRGDVSPLQPNKPEKLSRKRLAVPYVYGDLIEIRQVIHGRIVTDRYRVDAFLEGSPGRVILSLSRIATED